MAANVLIVDTNQHEANLLVKGLRDRNLQAEASFSGKEAIQKTQQTKYDAVIMDLMMPMGDEMDGITALTILKENNPDLQIIILTASASMENSLNAIKRGAFDFLKKPIDINSLVAIIQEASTRTRILAEKRAQPKSQLRMETPGREDKKVRDLMIPQEEYATVSQEATLLEAVIALEEARKNPWQGRDRQRDVIVLDNEYNVVGKVSQFDILRALEPKYSKISQLLERSGDGLNPEFMRTMIADFDLLRMPLQDLCRNAVDLKVIDIMHTPADSEYVGEDDTIDHAIHQLAIGRHQSLLVTEPNGKIIGVLKLADVFQSICDKIKTCKI